MHKLKTIDNKLKKKKTNGYVRKKTFDCRNIINLDEDISDMDTKIKNYPSIVKKNLFLENSINTKRANNRSIVKLKKIKTFNIPILKHCNSLTTNTSYGEKSMKKVTFSTVEIIRVEKYKKYNALCNFSKNQIKKNLEDVKQNDTESNSCFIF